MKGTIQDRFDAKVDKTPGHGPKGDCWLWTASQRSNGYGQFNLKVGTPMKRAHRVAFEIANGYSPGDMLVCHECDTPLCVNPKHLFLGSSKTNAQDMVAKGRHHNHNQKTTHCPAGHPYEGEHLQLTPKGYRNCRTCHNESQRARRALNRISNRPQ